MSHSAIKCWSGPASCFASSTRALGGGCLPTQLAHAACFHCVTFPNPLIVLGLLDNTFLSAVSTSLLSCELPLNTIFQQQLPSAQVTEMLCLCTRDRVSPLGVVWHPGGSTCSADHSRGHQRLYLQSRLSHRRPEHPALPLVPAEERRPCHCVWTMLGICAHCSACLPPTGSVFATRWTVHPLVQATEHFSY